MMACPLFCGPVVNLECTTTRSPSDTILTMSKAVSGCGLKEGCEVVHEGCRPIRHERVVLNILRAYVALRGLRRFVCVEGKIVNVKDKTLVGVLGNGLCLHLQAAAATVQSNSNKDTYFFTMVPL